MKQFINLQRDIEPGEATPLAGNSAEEVLDKNYEKPYRYRTIYNRAEVLKAMEEYASLKDNGLREALEKIADFKCSSHGAHKMRDIARAALNTGTKPMNEDITITFTRSELAALSIATAVLADRIKQIWTNGEGSINTREQDDGVVADAESANGKILKGLEEWIEKRVK